MNLEDIYLFIYLCTYLFMIFGFHLVVLRNYSWWYLGDHMECWDQIQVDYIQGKCPILCIIVTALGMVQTQNQT